MNVEVLKCQKYLLSEVNEAKFIFQCELCECNCRLNESVCN